MHPLQPRWVIDGRAPGSITVDDVRAAMAIAPPPVQVRLVEGEVTARAGVLLAVFDDADDAWLLLTRRAAHLRRNGGDVAFPGGRQDPGEDLVTTALREANEEVGLDPADVTVLGQLDHTVTLAGIEMVPTVGLLPGRPLNLVVNAAEVDTVLTVRLADLLVPDHVRGERWQEDHPVAGRVERDMYEFDLEGDTVWGATSRILHRFLELLTSV